MNKSNMINIDNSFKILKENTKSEVAVDILKKSAEDIFPYKFTVNVIEPLNNSPIFFMSVYPDRSTIDKIVSSITNNESNTVAKLWKQTKEWTVEIDSRILKPSVIDLTDRELTAIFCHEIGHVIHSNSIPTRLVTILQYELAKTTIGNKSLLKDKIFQKLLSLPIINACMGGSHDKDNIKEEIKADKFVKSMGYTNDLISVFKKYQAKKTLIDESKDMKQMAAFTLDALNQFKKRETSLLESTLDLMIKESSSEFANVILKEIQHDFFFENTETSVTKDKRLNYLYERAEKLEEEFIATEFFGIGKKHLKRIDPTEIDYIAVKAKSIKNNSDKMMLVTYIHSKLDIVEYYLSLMNNPKWYRRYAFPYTLEELENLKKYMLKILDEVINAKLPDRLRGGLLVAWPEGYEG